MWDDWECHAIYMCPCGEWFGQPGLDDPSEHFGECPVAQRLKAEGETEVALSEIVHVHLTPEGERVEI